MPTRADSAPRPRPAKVVFASLIGNVLEWYDFAVYGYFAAIIGRHFFPAEDPTVSLMAAFGVFAAGFVARPLGAVLLGHVADRFGRGHAMLASVTLMAVPTFLVGLLPTYAQIGAAAPALLLTLRLLQGASVGGEYTTSAVYAVEEAPAGRRGLIGSSCLIGANLGVLLGSGLGALLSHLLPAASLDAWGWRLPFLLGLLLGGFAILARRDLLGGMGPAEGEAADRPAGLPLAIALRTQWRPMLQLVGLVCITGTGFYVLFVYSVTYLTTVLHDSVREAFDINTLALCVILLAAPAGAALSDRIGRKPVLLGATGLLGLLAWPLFGLLHSPSPGVVLLAQCGFALLLGALMGTKPAVMSELFPRAVRGSATALPYNLAQALFGGLSPLLVTWLISRTGQDMAPAFLVMAAAAVAFLTTLTLTETAGRPLR